MVVVCLLGSSQAAAQDSGAEVPWVEVHGFVSQGFILSSRNNYLARSRRGSFEFAEVGLNVTKNVTDDFRIGMQLFTRDLGPVGNYKPQFDWFYLDYRFRDWFGIRAGRTKLPFGLYNEDSDTDSARVPILLPQSLYPTGNRDVLLAQTGGEVYGYVPLGAVGAFDYRLYGGTIFIDDTLLASPAATVTRVDIPYIFGGRGMWVTPLDGLRVGGSVQALRIEIDYQLSPATVAALQMAGQLPTPFGGTFAYRLPYLLGVGSLEYAAHDLLLAAEYSRWHTSYSTDPKVVPDGHVTATRWYVMTSYHVAPWFTPGAYYSAYDNGSYGPRLRNTYQHDLAVTARYDLTDNWLVKLEGHYMRGTLGLSSELNSGEKTALLAREWGVFLIKTTAYF